MLSDLCIHALGAKFDDEIILEMDDVREFVRTRKIQNLTIPWGSAEWRREMKAEFEFLKVCWSSCF